LRYVGKQIVTVRPAFNFLFRARAAKRASERLQRSLARFAQLRLIPRIAFTVTVNEDYLRFLQSYPHLVALHVGLVAMTKQGDEMMRLAQVQPSLRELSFHCRPIEKNVRAWAAALKLLPLVDTMTVDLSPGGIYCLADVNDLLGSCPRLTRLSVSTETLCTSLLVSQGALHCGS
jgi:hypothetical protein